MPKIQLEVNARFKGHKDALFALVAGLNPNTFLSSGGDGYVVAWNLDNPEEGKLLARVPHPVYSLLQPEPGSLLAGCSNGLIYHFNLDNNSLENTLQAHPNTGVFDLHLQQGKIYSLGGDGNLKIWSWPELQLERTIQISEKSLRQAQFNKQYLGIASSDHQIHLLDPESLEEKQVLRGHTNSVFSLCFCPDGTLVSGGRDALLKRWDLETGTELQSLPAHWFPINQIVLSPDQQLIATVSLDKTLKIWDTGTLELLKIGDLQKQGGHTSSVNKVSWLNEHQLITISDDRQLLGWRITRMEQQ